MKVAPIVAELQKYPDLFTPLIVHTGQHYDDKLSKVFFDDLGIPLPDVNLNVGSGSHAQQTAAVMAAFEPVLLERRRRSRGRRRRRELDDRLRAGRGEAGRPGGACRGRA